MASKDIMIVLSVDNERFRAKNRARRYTATDSGVAGRLTINVYDLSSSRQYD